MIYRYELLLMDNAIHRYYDYSDMADSLAKAVFDFLLANMKLLKRTLTIYCRKPGSGDLQYMGRFDGPGGRGGATTCHRHILLLANGYEYYLSDDGFIRYAP